MVVKGEKLTVRDQWEKLKKDLKGMTPREKLEHLWEYYKWVLGVFLGVVLVIGTVITACINLSTEIILAGAIVNVPVLPDGYVYLQTGYYERAKTEGRQAVELTNMGFANPFTTVEETHTLDVMESVTAMVAADVLDYVMFDDDALPFFMTPDLFADLRELFTEEELAAMGDAVIRIQIEETGETYPIALNIRDTDFFARYMEVDKNIYLAFSIRLPRKEACADFWQYIKGGQTEELRTVIAGVALDADVTEAGIGVLQDGYFRHCGCTVGDHRVELTEQSLFTPPENADDDALERVRAHVTKALKEGTLDYALCGAEALEELDRQDLLDLSSILSLQELEQYGQALVRREDGVAVALDLSGLSFGEKFTSGEPLYLVFSTKSQRVDACRDLWQYLKAQ